VSGLNVVVTVVVAPACGCVVSDPKIDVGPDAAAGALTDSAKLKGGAEVAAEAAILSNENSESGLPTVAGAEVVAAVELASDVFGVSDVGRLNENCDDEVAAADVGAGLAGSLAVGLNENGDDVVSAADADGVLAGSLTAGLNENDDVVVSAVDVAVSLAAGLNENGEEAVVVAGASEVLISPALVFVWNENAGVEDLAVSLLVVGSAALALSELSAGFPNENGEVDVSFVEVAKLNAGLLDGSSADAETAFVPSADEAANEATAGAPKAKVDVGAVDVAGANEKLDVAVVEDVDVTGANEKLEVAVVEAVDVAGTKENPDLAVVEAGVLVVANEKLGVPAVDVDVLAGANEKPDVAVVDAEVLVGAKENAEVVTAEADALVVVGSSLVLALSAWSVGFAKENGDEVVFDAPSLEKSNAGWLGASVSVALLESAAVAAEETKENGDVAETVLLDSVVVAAEEAKENGEVAEVVMLDSVVVAATEPNENGEVAEAGLLTAANEKGLLSLSDAAGLKENADAVDAVPKVRGGVEVALLTGAKEKGLGMLDVAGLDEKAGVEDDVVDSLDFDLSTSFFSPSPFFLSVSSSPLFLDVSVDTLGDANENVDCVGAEIAFAPSADEAAVVEGVDVAAETLEPKVRGAVEVELLTGAKEKGLGMLDVVGLNEKAGVDVDVVDALDFDLSSSFFSPSSLSLDPSSSFLPPPSLFLDVLVDS